MSIYISYSAIILDATFFVKQELITGHENILALKLNYMKFFLLLFSLGPLYSFAQDRPSVVDRAHLSLSNSILSLSDTIDGFFANDKHENLKNKSRLKFSVDTYFREGRGPYARPEINYQLQLPRTQKRFQLFVQSLDKEDETSDAKLESEGRGQDQDNQNLTAGIRYMLEKNGIEFYTDTGVIVNIPVTLFIRSNIVKRVSFTSWLLKIHEQVKWVYDDATTSDLDLDFDRRLSSDVLFRFVNNIFWSDEDYIIQFENGPSFFQQLNSRSAIAYHAHIISLNQPELIISNYLLQVSYRRDIYKKWLFFDFTPFVNFPREENFHRTPGLKIGLQAVIGHI